MLAGRMRLGNFVILLVLAGVVGAGGLYVACKGKPSDEPAPAPAPTPARIATPPVQPPPSPVTPPAPVPAGSNTRAESHDDLGARDYDAEVIAWKDKSIAGDKQKDVSKGKPYKINVFRDGGARTVNRVKIDINRNEKFDEKVTFEPGKITMQRAPADDEKYTETYHWSGTGWIKQP